MNKNLRDIPQQILASPSSADHNGVLMERHRQEPCSRTFIFNKELDVHPPVFV